MIDIAKADGRVRESIPRWRIGSPGRFAPALSGPTARLLVCAVVSIPILGCSRLTGLPAVPASVSARDAGLEDLKHYADQARLLDRALSDDEHARFSAAPPGEPLDMARWGQDRIARGDETGGLHELATALERDPSDLVVGNAYRMAVHRLKRRQLAAAKSRGERTPSVPEWLGPEPLATLERIAEAAPSREIRLQVALAYVDRMILNPALEIKAPASIDSVRRFTAILEADAHYVPALVGRGLNYLYRPASLAWPEHPAPPRDAATRDLSLAAAVGAKVGGASPRLKGILLTVLGDACAHDGDVGVARSWWMLARETSDDPAVREGIAVRMGWPDRDVPQRLEAHLEERMADMDDSVGDLSFLWRDGARGPS